MTENNFEFKKDRILIVVEEGEIAYIVATEDFDVIVLDKDQEDFDDFHNIDQLDEVVDHETFDQVVNGVIKEFQEDFRTAEPNRDNPLQ